LKGLYDQAKLNYIKISQVNNFHFQVLLVDNVDDWATGEPILHNQMTEIKPKDQSFQPITKIFSKNSTAGLICQNSAASDLDWYSLTIQLNYSFKNSDDSSGAGSIGKNLTDEDYIQRLRIQNQILRNINNKVKNHNKRKDSD
jgi:hypothetical protein